MNQKTAKLIRKASRILFLMLDIKPLDRIKKGMAYSPYKNYCREIGNSWKITPKDKKKQLKRYLIGVIDEYNKRQNKATSSTSTDILDNSPTPSNNSIRK